MPTTPCRRNQPISVCKAPVHAPSNGGGKGVGRAPKRNDAPIVIPTDPSSARTSSSDEELSTPAVAGGTMPQRLTRTATNSKQILTCSKPLDNHIASTDTVSSEREARKNTICCGPKATTNQSSTNPEVAKNKDPNYPETTSKKDCRDQTAEKNERPCDRHTATNTESGNIETPNNKGSIFPEMCIHTVTGDTETKTKDQDHALCDSKRSAKKGYSVSEWNGSNKGYFNRTSTMESFRNPEEKKDAFIGHQTISEKHRANSSLGLEHMENFAEAFREPTRTRRCQSARPVLSNSVKEPFARSNIVRRCQSARPANDQNRGTERPTSVANVFSWIREQRQVNRNVYGNEKEFAKWVEERMDAKRDMIVFCHNPPAELGLFPQYTNFVKPMRLNHRRKLSNASSSQSEIDFDNYDEMDRLFSESELVFSEDAEESDNEMPEQIVIDRSKLFAEFVRRKTPPPPIPKPKPKPKRFVPGKGKRLVLTASERPLPPGSEGEEWVPEEDWEVEYVVEPRRSGKPGAKGKTSGYNLNDLYGDVVKGGRPQRRGRRRVLRHMEDGRIEEIDESYEEDDDEMYTGRATGEKRPKTGKGARGGKGGGRAGRLGTSDDKKMVQPGKPILKTASELRAESETPATALATRFTDELTPEGKEEVSIKIDESVSPPAVRRESWLREYVRRESQSSDEEKVPVSPSVLLRTRYKTTRVKQPFVPKPLLDKEDVSGALSKMMRQKTQRNLRLKTITEQPSIITSLSRDTYSRISTTSGTSTTSKGTGTDSEEEITIHNLSTMKLAESTSPVPIWMQARLGLSMLSSRFTVPQDYRVLERMTPIDYVKCYCVVSSHRQDLCDKIFNKIKKRRSQILSYQGLRTALEAMFIQSLGENDINEIFDILDIQDTLEVDQKMFAAIAGFAERVLCPRMNAAEDSGHQRPKKSMLERADLSRMLQRARSMGIHPGVRKIMEMLMEQLD